MSFIMFFFAFDLTIHKLSFYRFTCAGGVEQSQYSYATEHTDIGDDYVNTDARKN